MEAGHLAGDLTAEGMMRRLATITGISLIVIVASVAVLAATPAVRMAAQRVFSRQDNVVPLDPHLRQQAEAHPRDAQAWLALSVGGKQDIRGQVSLDRAALSHVLELRPEWPAPYLLLAGELVRTGPQVWRDELAAVLRERTASVKQSRVIVLNASQRAHIQGAREALEKARALDPGNAAPDYLLAYLALEEHRDDEALALLHSGLNKKRWSMGRRDANIALYETALRSLPAIEADSFVAMSSPAHGFGAYARLRELARIVTGISIVARDHGDHARAIFLRESVMHLGRVMIADAYTHLDAMVGTAVWQIAASDRLTRAEEAAIVARFAKSRPGDTTAAEEAMRQARLRAHRAKFARYLREQGRADLAAQVIEFGDELTAWHEQVSTAMRSWHSWTTGPFKFLYEFAEFGLWVAAAGAALGLLLICGVVGLVLVAVKRRPAPVTWARWKWALVLAGCFGLYPAVARAWRWGLREVTDAGSNLPHGALAPYAVLTVAAGLVLLVLSALEITWRVRRASEPGAYPGLVRHYVGTLAAVLLPIVALLLAIAAVWATPANARFNKGVEHLNVAIYDNEFALHGLARPALGIEAGGPQGNQPRPAK